MKNVRPIVALMVLMGSVFFGVSVSALSESDYDRYEANHIIFYDPEGCTAGASNLGGGSDTIVDGESYSSNLEGVVRQYGELAMDLQREWGTPWEVVFAQMQIESGTGKAGLAKGVAKNGYYNWLGISGKGGEYSVHISYKNSHGDWAQYASIENMIRDWAGKYVARSDLVDRPHDNYIKAFAYLDPNNYDMRSFASLFLDSYAPEGDGNNKAVYMSNIFKIINGTIKKVREEKGWPSSEELAKQENIPIGGRHPFGGNSDGVDEQAPSCVKLTSSPDYNSSSYQGRLSNLHNLSQLSSVGKFGKEYMNPNDLSKRCSNGSETCTISLAGCGIMSVYAAFYMFSGQGLDDASVFSKFRDATISDSGYNQTSASNVPSFGSNSTSVTQMQKEVLFDNDSYQGDKWDTLVSALKSGKKIAILVSASDGSLFTPGGHYMMLDHYNNEKDMVYLFDSAASKSGSKENKLKSYVDSGDIEYYNDNIADGMYVSREAMDSIVKPKEATAFSYEGCYNGGATNICRASSATGGLKDGGMSYEEAVEFMAAYREEASLRKFGAYGAGQPNGTVIGEGYIHGLSPGSECKSGTLNNCVAFSKWFVNNYTTAGPKAKASGDGKDYAKSLISNDDFIDNGTTPTVYAIFSNPGGNHGHTGVVLGINASNDEIYIGEAACSNGFVTSSDGKRDWPGVHIKSLKSYTDSKYTYAYPGDKLKL